MIGSQYVRSNPTRVFPKNKAYAYLGARQTITSGSWQKVKLDTELYDVLGEFDNVTNFRFTAQHAGYYLIIAGATFVTIAGSGGTECDLCVMKNGETVGGPTALVQDYQKLPDKGYCKWLKGQAVVYLDVDDYIELFAYQNSGSNEQLERYPKHTFLCVVRLA